MRSARCRSGQAPVPEPRRVRTDRVAAGGRLRVARAYLEAAELAASEERNEFANVAVGTAVLAGIAASDAICGFRLGQRHRGEDHQGAAGLLEEATPDGAALAQQLTRLLALKDTGHYGVTLISASDASRALRWAGRLVERAAEEAER